MRGTGEQGHFGGRGYLKGLGGILGDWGGHWVVDTGLGGAFRGARGYLGGLGAIWRDIWGADEGLGGLFQGLGGAFEGRGNGRW